MKATCKVEDCDGHGRTKGLSPGHYTRLRKTGDVQAHLPLVRRDSGKPKVCTVDNCDDPAIAAGLCSAHYSRQQRTGSTELPPAKPRVQKPNCEAPGCDNRSFARRLCSGH